MCIRDREQGRRFHQTPDPGAESLAQRLYAPGSDRFKNLGCRRIRGGRRWETGRNHSDRKGRVLRADRRWRAVRQRGTAGRKEAHDHGRLPERISGKRACDPAFLRIGWPIGDMSILVWDMSNSVWDMSILVWDMSILVWDMSISIWDMSPFACPHSPVYARIPKPIITIPEISMKYL